MKWLVPYDQLQFWPRALVTSKNHVENLKKNWLWSLLKILKISVKEKMIVLFTWGIDSTTLLYWMLHEKKKNNISNADAWVYPLQILRKWMPEIELKIVDEICEILWTQVHRVDYPEGKEETYFEYLLLAKKYCSQVNATKILVWQVFTDRHSWDWEWALDKQSWLATNRLVNRITKSYNVGIKVYSPFGYIPKKEVIDYGRSIWAPLDMTVSCPYYDVKSKPCWVCPQCEDRNNYL